MLLVSSAGEALEYATFLSTKASDTKSFELHIAQVKAYYRDFKYAEIHLHRGAVVEAGRVRGVIQNALLLFVI